MEKYKHLQTEHAQWFHMEPKNAEAAAREEQRVVKGTGPIAANWVLGLG